MQKADWTSIGVLIFCAQLGIGAQDTGPSLQAGPVVRIESGEIRGFEEPATQVFLGVPFAAAPVKELRWRGPVPVAPWGQVRDVDHPAKACAAYASGKEENQSSEDCLYLNVYRPSAAKPGKALPVMVFLHGGGNVSGSPNEYDGARMASVGEAIVVIPAFRLGAFGLLALPSMGASAGAFMLQDQLAALVWVQRNIAAFGGNPHDVTVSGQSSGAVDTCVLLAAPAAKGLFRQAILESGSCGRGPDVAQAEAAGVAFAKQLGCDGAAAEPCLRGKTAEEVTEGWHRVAGMSGSAPFGGPLLPISAGDAVVQGSELKIPVLMGFTEDELWRAHEALYPLSEEGYQRKLKELFPGQETKVEALYLEAQFPHREDLLGAEVGDSRIICPALETAARLARSTRVSMYEFADRSLSADRAKRPGSGVPEGYSGGASHGAELRYLYGSESVESRLSAAQQQLQDELIRLWVGFNRSTPDPWPVYARDARVVTRIGADGQMVEPSEAVYDAHRCGLWNGR